MRRARTGKRLRTVAVADPNGSGGELPSEETRRAVEHLELMLRVRLGRVPVLNTMVQVPEGVDLLLFDFGGAEGYGPSRMADQSCMAIRWAEEHPSSLLLVTSSFTWARGVREEMAQLGMVKRYSLTEDEDPEPPNPAPANILPLHDYLSGRVGALEAVAAWLGVELRR